MSDGECLPSPHCPPEPLSLPALDARLRETQRLLARFRTLDPCALHQLATNLDSIADHLDAIADRAECDEQ